MAPATTPDGDAMRAKYEALAALYAATEEDASALAARYEAVQSRLEKTRAENEYLLGQLCEYAPSDFESDLSDLERDEELLAKRFPLPRLEKTSSSARTAASRRKTARSAPMRKRSAPAARKPTAATKLAK